MKEDEYEQYCLECDELVIVKETKVSNNIKCEDHK